MYCVRQYNLWVFVLLSWSGKIVPISRAGAVSRCIPPLDFEDGFHNWLQLPASSWQLNSTLADNTGNAITLASDRVSSRLQSIQLQYTGVRGPCQLTFKYQLWGSASLVVRLATNPSIQLASRESHYSSVWERTGSSTETGGWKQASVALPQERLALFQLYFDGSRSNFDDEVIVDDIIVRNCCLTECHTLNTFDDGWDGWKSHTSPANELSWLRRKGRTPSDGTGPSHGYQGQGYYLYIETSPTQQENATAILSSPVLFNKVPSKSCIVSFPYHMFGHHIGSLQVAVKHSTNWTATHRLWTVNGNQGDSWRRSPSLNLLLGAATSFQIMITATRGAGHQSDIAIDEISIDAHCSCPYIVHTDASTSTSSTTPANNLPPPAANNSKEERLETAVIVISILLLAVIIAAVATSMYFRRACTKQRTYRRTSSSTRVSVFAEARPSVTSPPGLSSLPEEADSKRRSSRGSWHMKLSLSGQALNQAASSNASEHIDITESLLDLMETSDTGANTPEKRLED